MKANDTHIKDLLQSTDNFLTLIEQEVRSSKEYHRVSETVGNLPHPPREMLYDYVLDWLKEDDEGYVQEHIADCAVCARQVFHIMRLEREIPSVKPDWEVWVKNVTSIPSHLISWVSELWQPQWAGVSVSAADIPEEKKAFSVKDGEIEISCLWRAQHETTPAYIQISWAANFVADRELWALFFNPDTKEVLAEVPLGTYLEGGKSITSEILGFDPSNEKWAISILLKEQET